MKHELIQRGRLTYYITDSAVVVHAGSQYISYNIYSSPSRSDLGVFKKKIKASKKEQYTTVVDLMDLAQRCKVIGVGVQKPGWIE